MIQHNVPIVHLIRHLTVEDSEGEQPSTDTQTSTKQKHRQAWLTDGWGSGVNS